MITIVGIYKITNLINGKIYVGQSIDITDRWKQHIYKAFNHNERAFDSPIHQAFRKYGKDNFRFEVLEECSANELDNRERYWIKKLNSLSPNGYNISPGGQKFKRKERKCKQCREVIYSRYATLCPECLLKLNTTVFPYKPEGLSNEEKIFYAKQIIDLGFTKFAEQYQRTGTAAQKWCRKIGIPHLKKELIEWYNSQMGIIPEKKKAQKKPVYQIDKETGKIIARFESANQAGLAMGARKGNHISEACNGKLPTAYGYIWKYVTEEV